ncbi:MAG: hypothetical protein FD135_2347 [Comamonadaceae bacterium]|nr:MAG: hypothetical protein FD135_2347 [Comamonadaceae bacterium]
MSPQKLNVYLVIDHASGEHRFVDRTGKPTHTVDSLMSQVFAPGIPPRSPAYKAGAKSQFDRHLNKAPIICIAPAGSAEFDAFWAGADMAKTFMRLHDVKGSV